jgi:hypothetical protein
VIANPKDVKASVSVELFGGEGQGIWRKVVEVEGRGSAVVKAADLLPGPAPTGYGARFSGRQPFFVERVVDGARDGMVSPASLPSLQWYFPAMPMNDGYDTTVWVLNPWLQAVFVTTTLISGQTQPLVQSRSVPAASSLAIPVVRSEAMSGSVGMTLQASGAVVADYMVGFDNGHVLYGGPGVADASTLSYLALGNGQAGDGFEQWLSVLNPSAGEAAVKVSLVRGGKRAPVGGTVSVPAGGKKDVYLTGLIPAGEHAGVVVESNRPVAAHSVTLNKGKQATAAHASQMPATPAAHWSLPGLILRDGSYSYLALLNPGPKISTVSVILAAGRETQLTRKYTLRAQEWINLSIDALAGDQTGSLLAGRLLQVDVSSTQPIVVERLTVSHGRAVASGGATDPK